MSFQHCPNKLPVPSSIEMPMFNMHNFFDEEEEDKDSVGLVSVEDSWSAKSDTNTNTEEPSGMVSNTENLKSSTVVSSSSSSGKVFDLTLEEGEEDREGHGVMPPAPGNDSAAHSHNWAAILGFQVDSSPKEDDCEPTVTETYAAYEAVGLAANSFESQPQAQSFDGFGGNRYYAEGSEYQSSGNGDGFGSDRDNESFASEGEEDEEEDEEEEEEYQSQSPKRAHWDAFKGPVSRTTEILDRCLETMYEDIGSSYVTSAMEFLAEDSFLMEPPAKKQRSSCMEIIDAAFEAHVSHSRKHIQTMNSIEHAVHQLQRENAQLRHKLGITPEETLASMAADYPTKIPVEGYDDESRWHDSITSSWGMDGETVSFLKKYLV